MTNLSISTHQFCPGDIIDNYTCVRYLLNISDKISNDQMHKQAVDYYFSTIRQFDCYGWCNDRKHQALAILYDIIICLVYEGQDDKEEPIVTIKFYGDKTSLNKKYIYMLYDEAKYNFNPLYVREKENSTEIMTIFDHDDTVKNLLREYIKNDLKYNGGINLDVHDDIDVNKASIPTDDGVNTAVCVKDVSNNTDDSNEPEIISNLVVQDTGIKRKASELDRISPNNDKQLSISMPHEYYAFNKHVKLPEDAADQMSTDNKNNSETMEMKKLLQTDDVSDESDMHDIQMNEQEVADPPMVLNKEHKEELVNKLVDGIQDNDEFNYNNESSKTKPLF